MPVLDNERRINPRIESKLPVSIAADGYSFKTITENLSCVGAYCQIPKYLPPFTKIAVTLSLPVKKSRLAVSCKGVIVRSEDSKTGGFSIAVFFNEIKDTQRKKITQYIKQFLPA